VSANNNDNIIRMANQIATYFASYPHDEALAGVVNHLEKFWEKRMRLQLHQYVDHGGTALHPLIVEAEKQIERAHPPLAVAHTTSESNDGIED